MILTTTKILKIVFNLLCSALSLLTPKKGGIAAVLAFVR